MRLAVPPTTVWGMSNQTRRRATATLVAAATLALPAVAGAAPVREDWVAYEYAATVEGAMSISVLEQSDVASVTETRRLRLDYRAEFRPEFQFTSRRELIAGATADRVVLSNVDAEIHFLNNEIQPPGKIDCSGRSASTLSGLAYPLAPFQPQLPPTSMQLTPMTEVKVDVSCSGDGWRTFEFGLTGELREQNVPLQPVFDVPRAEVGSNWFIVAFARRSSSIERCPLRSGSWGIVSCESQFSGTIRFVRTYSMDDDLALVPLVPAKPKVVRRAKQAELQVECPRGCEAEIGVFMRPVGGRGRIHYPRRGRGGRSRSRAVSSAAAVRPIASRAIRVKAGRGRRTLVLAIPAAERKALLKAGRAYVAVSLDPPSGRTVRRSFAVAVPR